jgi:hypothetical protein
MYKGNLRENTFTRIILFDYISSSIFINHYLHFLFQNIKKKMYGCTEALLADAKWILHNCIIFNGSKYEIKMFQLYL